MEKKTFVTLDRNEVDEAVEEYLLARGFKTKKIEFKLGLSDFKCNYGKYRS